MNPIMITTGNQTTEFTNTEIIMSGTAYPYSGITRMVYIPQQSAYAIACNGQTGIFSFEEKDAQLVHALMERIAQALHLSIEEHDLPAADQMEEASGEGSYAESDVQDSSETASMEDESESIDAQEDAGSSGIFSDRKFLIELIAGILLVLLGIIGFVLR